VAQAGHALAETQQSDVRLRHLQGTPAQQLKCSATIHLSLEILQFIYLLCWLLVVSVGQNWPVRTPYPSSCSLPIPERKSTIESMHLLIFTKGEWTLCKGFSPS
jgi:hypothetical protein